MPLQNAFETNFCYLGMQKNAFETNFSYLGTKKNAFESSLSIWACEKMRLKPTSVTCGSFKISELVICVMWPCI